MILLQELDEIVSRRLLSGPRAPEVTQVQLECVPIKLAEAAAQNVHIDWQLPGRCIAASPVVEHWHI